MPLELTMICAPYDRARALIEGTVKPEGIDLRVHVDADDVNRHFDGHGGHYDVAEFFTGRYIVDLPFRTLGFTAIPIFVKRMFRHSYIYVSTGAGIAEPADLNGKRVGIQSWFTTTALWARGILEEEHGVDLRSIQWVAGRPPENPHEWTQPNWLKLEVVDGYGKLRALLLAGELDAVITTATLVPEDRPRVDFLFPDYARREREYYRRTGFFPIQHTLLVRTSILDRHPWVARSLFDAWQESKRRCYEWLEWQRVHQTGLWYRALWEEEHAAAGDDPYRWGFRETRAEVDKMLEYAQRQGLTRERFAPEDMFHPTMLDT